MIKKEAYQLVQIPLVHIPIQRPVPNYIYSSVKQNKETCGCSLVIFMMMKNLKCILKLKA